MDDRHTRSHTQKLYCSNLCNDPIWFKFVLWLLLDVQDKNYGYISLSKSYGVHTKLRPPKNVISRVESRAHNVPHTHTHIVDLLTQVIHIRTINTKPLYLNCQWISETEPSINKEHFCEVSNLGDKFLTPVQINSHKYMEQITENMIALRYTFIVW